MKVKLRDYQTQLITDIYNSWQAGNKNVLAVSPTGSGKAFTLCTLAEQLVKQGYPVPILVHRKELVSQLCMTLATLGVRHNIIAQKDTILEVQDTQRKEFGESFYDITSGITVCSVDTLRSRISKYTKWLHEQRVWILDEAAHLLANNKWGQVVQAMPNALGVGFTATPQRLDKKGLGRHAFGLFDDMVEGPKVKWLIGEGFLSNYRIVVPESDYRKYLKDNGNDKSDYTFEDREYASAHSHIVGDVVKNYIKWCNGKQTIVFADSVGAGQRMEDEFRTQGIQAKLLTGETPSPERRMSIAEFANNTLPVLINVDLFDEGFDIPARKGKRIIEAVIMARPTKSLSKYLQIFGRGLRPAFAEGFDLSTREGRLAAQVASYKPYAIIIDHVGNMGIGKNENHGLPDKIRKWTLDNIVRKRESVNLLHICGNHMCNSPYDRALSQCPYCGWERQKLSRSGDRSPKEELEMVDGDMELLDPETIRQLEINIELESPNRVAERVAAVAGRGAGEFHKRKQQERIDMQKTLAETIALWAGKQKHVGYTDRQIKKKFYNEFGETVTVALSLPTRDMQDMNDRIRNEIY